MVIYGFETRQNVRQLSDKLWGQILIEQDPQA